VQALGNRMAVADATRTKGWSRGGLFGLAVARGPIDPPDAVPSYGASGVVLPDCFALTWQTFGWPRGDLGGWKEFSVSGGDWRAA